jgi:hypothetical protein
MWEAIDAFIERQQAIVETWDELVRSQGEVHKKSHESGISSVSEVEKTIGSSDSTVSRWRKALEDLPAYLTRLSDAAERAAGLLKDPNAVRPTPDRDVPHAA